MADLLTPSSVTMTTINASAESPKSNEGAKKVPKPKPEKPDERKYQESLAKAQEEHAIAQQKVDAMKAKIENCQPNNRDSPAGKRQQELKSELQSIREQQSVNKVARTKIQNEIAGLETELKSRIAEQKIARSRISFRNVEELEREISRLDKQIDTGEMKLVDEKKALAEISSWRKQKRSFPALDEAQRVIEGLRSRMSEHRKTLDNPEVKALSQKYDDVHRELSALREESDKSYKNLNHLRDERTKLNKIQQDKYAAIREVKDQYYKARTAYRDWDQEQYKIRQDKAKSEREAQLKEKRQHVANERMEQAGQPAFLDEILTAEGLIRYFEPSTVETSKSLRGPSGLAAEAQRSVQVSDFQGIKVCRKEDREENYFSGTGGKKGKKGKKGSNATSPGTSTPTEGKFNINPGIIHDLAKINMEPPISQAEVPALVEKIKEKRDQWKREQASKTNENIEKARKEIDRLEIEATEAQNSGPPPGNNRSEGSPRKEAWKMKQVNGANHVETEPKKDQGTVKEVAKPLKDTSVKDETEE